MNNRHRLAAVATAIALTAAAPIVVAQETKSEPGRPAQQAQPYGPGSGYGRGYGPGYGMGPGMMGGYGYGDGPGMMGGRDCGPGMMGLGTMMGPAGMGRMRAIWSLDLSDEQAGRIDTIHDGLHRKHRALMSQMWEAQDRLRDLYDADNRDPSAIGKAYAQVNDLRRQMFEAHVQAEKQMEEVLTQEQREQLRREYRRGQRFGRYGR